MVTFRMRPSVVWPLPISPVSSFDIAPLARYLSVSVNYLSFPKAVSCFFFCISEPLHMLFPLPGMTSLFHLHLSCLPLPSWHISTHFSGYTSSIFSMKTCPCMPSQVVHFLFCPITVISISFCCDSYHHCTTIVYFYVPLQDFELLEGKDWVLFISLKKRVLSYGINIIKWMKYLMSFYMCIYSCNHHPDQDANNISASSESSVEPGKHFL